MASVALETELAGLSGSELVARLRTTTRRVDYEAAARVLDARDGRLAAAEVAVAEAKKLLDARHREHTQLKEGLAAALALVDVLKEKLNARGGPRSEERGGPGSKDAHGGPRSEDARGGSIEAPAPAQRGGPGSKDARGEPRSEDAGPGDAIEAPAPPQLGELGAEVTAEQCPVVIDLCSSGDEEEEREECRAGDSGVSRKRKASAPEVNGEGPRTKVSWKGNAAASAPSSDDEDDSLTLSQLMKKRGGAQPGVDGEPKSTDRSVRPLGGFLPKTSLVIKQEIVEETVCGSDEPKEATFVQGRGDVESGEHGGMSRAMPSPPALSFALVNGTLRNPSLVNSAVPLGNGLPKTPVIRECPEARLVQSVGMENGKSAEDVGVNKAMLSPTTAPPGFAARTGSQKNISKGDHVEATIVGKEGSLGSDILKTPPVIMERPEAIGGSEQPKVAAFVQERVKIKSEVDEGVPPGFPARTGSHKNLSNAEYGEPRIAPKECSFAGPQGNTPSKVRTPSPFAKKIVEAAQAGVQSPKGRTVSALGDSIVLGLEAGRKWESGADVFISCLENKELCMNAACALYRQKKPTFQPTVGGQSGSTGLQRMAKLVEFLLDGNVDGPLKRTAEELMIHDSTGPTFLEDVVCEFCEQLFDIYRNKEDPYFR
ncbi:hypothetical protein EJB05_17611, partial [Eragrostis curvula]